jgi:hypothetical protein
MRHSATGRHAEYAHPSRVSYLIAALAALAAVITALVFASQNAPAQAQVTRAAGLMDRAAEIAVASDASVLNAEKTTAATAQLAASQAQAAQAAIAAATYTVHRGDTLSKVAGSRCGTARDWTGIYAASRARGWTARNANTLTAGQHLFISCSWDPQEAKYAPATTHRRHIVLTSANVSTSSHYRRSVTATTYSGGGGMQSCIISRESGGSSQIWNASGHYGLYQFSAATWAAHGGNPADFGHASAAEQTQVFESTVAADGYSDWSPYDGC